MSVDALVKISLKALEKNKPIATAGTSNKMPEIIMRRIMPRNTASKVFGSMIGKIAPDASKM